MIRSISERLQTSYPTALAIALSLCLGVAALMFGVLALTSKLASPHSTGKPSESATQSDSRTDKDEPAAQDESPDYGTLCGGIAQLAGTTITIATLLFLADQSKAQQHVTDMQLRLTDLQTRLLGATAAVDAQNARISEAKAIIQTLWKGDEVPLERQAVPSKGGFDDLKRQLESMFVDPDLRKLAGDQLLAWQQAAQARDKGVAELESLGKRIERMRTEPPYAR